MTQEEYEAISKTTPEDRRVLALASRETLALWWEELNRWGWPAGLPDPEPPEQYTSDGRRAWILGWIETLLGDTDPRSLLPPTVKKDGIEPWMPERIGLTLAAQVALINRLMPASWGETEADRVIAATELRSLAMRVDALRAWKAAVIGACVDKGITWSEADAADSVARLLHATGAKT